MPRSTVRVTLADGNHFTTEINLDADGARKYYAIGTTLNMGIEGDNLQRITQVDIL